MEFDKECFIITTSKKAIFMKKFSQTFKAFKIWKVVQCRLPPLKSHSKICFLFETTKKILTKQMITSFKYFQVELLVQKLYQSQYFSFDCTFELHIALFEIMFLSYTTGLFFFFLVKIQLVSKNPIRFQTLYKLQNIFSSSCLTSIPLS